MVTKILMLSLVCVLIHSILLFDWSSSCNEAVCASIVSKCLLTQSCKCDLKNCTCCKDCSNCLSYLYTECCSCVNICPQPNITEHELHKKSHVEDLNDPIPDLFDALTLEKDELLRWSVYKFPTHKNLAILSPGDGKEIKFTTISSKDNESPEIVELNCTVAYMSKCLSWNKCKASCLSMGASSYRWFHDGCCECVGHKCINYGIGESRCLQCPPSQSEDSEFDEIPIEETEYGLDNAIGVDDVEAKELYIDKNHHKASKSQKFEDKKPLKRAKSE